jgi:hypothetical protein
MEAYESLTREMYAPEAASLGADVIERITEAGEKIAETAGRIRTAYETGGQPPAPPKQEIPRGAIVLGVIALVLIAFGLGGRGR